MHVSITGAGRSGTTIVGQVFSLHPCVEFRHEKSGLWVNSQFAVAPYSRLLPDDAKPERRKRLVAWADSRKMLVEKDPRHVGRLGFMRRCWPDARFIYLLRDPRDLACSVFNAINSGKAIPMERWVRQRSTSLPPGSMEGLPPLLQILTWWHYMVQADLDDMRGDPLFRVVQYEHLLRDPRGQFASLFHWVGLNVTPKVERFLCNVSDDPSVHVAPLSASLFVPGHRRRVGRWTYEWPASQALQATDIAGDLMHQWGYC